MRLNHSQTFIWSFIVWLMLLAFGVSPLAVAQSNIAATENKTSKDVDLSQPMTIGWRYDSDQTIGLTPARDYERVYLPLAEGVIVSLSASNGQLNWRSEMGGEISASPVADSQHVYVASETGKPEAGTRRATGALRAVGREGGLTQWMRTLAMPLRGSLIVGNGKLFGGSADGRIYAFDAKTGAARWTHDYGSSFNAQPVLSGSRLYIGAEDGNLLALDESTGKLLWFYRTKGPVRGPVANGSDVVYFGSGDGHVYAVNATNGRLLWRSRLGAGVQAVVRVEDDLLVASLDNFVYKFSANGRRIWKRQLSGRISSQPLTSGADALFTPLSSAAGVVLELRDGKPVNSLPVGEEISNSASPIAVGDAVLLTIESGLVAFRRPRETQPLKKE